MENFIVKNVMEDLTRILYGEVLQSSNFCSCERCKSDVIAITLNNLPPRYVVSLKGEVYAKIDILYVQTRADIVREITKAMEVVQANPNH